jgi:hypothetical protein
VNSLVENKKIAKNKKWRHMTKEMAPLCAKLENCSTGGVT